MGGHLVNKPTNALPGIRAYLAAASLHQQIGLLVLPSR
jgi:hypothetical protein